MRRMKLMPPDNMAIISVWYAIFEVKNITAMNVNRPLYWFMKSGTKLR